MMTTVENLPILVGVDGSEPSAAATRWAVAEARLRGRSLRLVCAYTWPVPAGAFAAAPFVGSEASLREEAEARIEAAVKAVVAEAPDLPVSGRAVYGDAAHVLLELSGQACLLVVGHRGRGGFASLLLGSVAAKVSAHAHGPVVVVRPDAVPPTGPGPVVVGVDGSAASDAATGFAFEEADRRGVAVHLVHGWTPPAPPWRTDVRPLSYDVAELETAEAHLIREWAQPWLDKFPQVPTEYRLVAAQPATTLIDASRGAALLVVGSRGHGGFAGLVLGSVSQQAIHHASCPVAVVR